MTEQVVTKIQQERCGQVPWSRSQPAVGVDRVPGVPEAGLDDAVLVAAARANPEAFTYLYRRYANLVYRFCDLRLGSREAAEDATSEVFLKALAGLDSFRGGLFAGWLFRIAHNVVIDAYRRRRHERVSVPFESVTDVMDREPLPDEHAISRSDLEAVRRAVRSLPDDQRTVLELQITGLSTEEIAAALARSPNAVRILRYRALGRLRDVLADGGIMPERGGAA